MGGQACHRTACPNDCSGHGRCKYLGDIPKYGSIYDHGTATDYYQSMYLTAENYHGWDNLKTRGCVCDPGWLDVDCSKRICPHGNDPMTVRKNVNLPDSIRPRQCNSNHIRNMPTKAEHFPS